MECEVAVILFCSNADTELLALRSVIDDLPGELGEIRGVHPARTDMESLRRDESFELVVVRLLGGRGAWEAPFDELRSDCLQRGVPLVAVGGEAAPDAELARASSVPAGVVAEAHRYLAAGGPANLANLLLFLSDTLLLRGHGFEPPAELAAHGVWTGAGLGRPGATRRSPRPLVAVVFYRAHLVAGNTTYVAELCAALEAAGADALPIFTYSLRADADGTVPAVRLCSEAGVDVVITSTLAAGAAGASGAAGATGAPGGCEDALWEIPALVELGVAVIQSPASSRSREAWAADAAGLSPVDVAMGVAIPEFDGRIIGPTAVFKEVVDGGSGPGREVVATRTDPERAERLARLAVRLATLRRRPPEAKRVAVVLSAYPTKRSRLGNAVGLDTPASAIEVLEALAGAGYRVERIPPDGDTLMAELTDHLTYETPLLSDAQAALAAGRLDTEAYNRWFTALAEPAGDDVEAMWGPPPGEVYAHDGALVFPGLDLGGVLVTIQPPRGFGADPIGTYHSPDMPPPHHYLGFYRWLAAPLDRGGWGADAVIHLGKHGTLEWLPGKALGLSAACFPAVGIDDLPCFYPFVVNDPGEGSQAKRRTHAVVIDHLPPPLTRADVYDELAQLERLLDTYAQVASMDPAKLPLVRAQVWDLLVAAEIHRDLQLGETPPDGESFDNLIVHVDGYLCALKDAQIRGGLHVLGQAPVAEALIDVVLAITRLAQGAAPSLRDTVAGRMGIDLGAGTLTGTDAVEAECRRLVADLAATGWDAATTSDPTLRWVATALVANLEQTTDEIDHLLDGLAGRYVPAGPSGAPSRGGAHVLPTGRNFYSVDPKAIPSPLAWEVGRALADRLIERHVGETGTPPRTVGLVLWGTAAMRTTGDDAAEALALLGVRPLWDPESLRVSGIEAIGLAELGRPRVDVTLRISGFFRDAFPHVIDLLDDAVRLVAALDEPAADNPLRAGDADDSRIYGPPPGGYGSGILAVIEQGSWRSDADLAEVYLAWSGFAYGRDCYGEAAPQAMRRRFAAIEVAVKNQDNREHDIFDSDDYLQDHGGMVAAVRALTGAAPRAWFGDSSDPANPAVRSLAEEAARVVRSRVLNPKWIDAMRRHGYKGAFELAATVDYLFGYDATAHVVENWMYERVTAAYVADPDIRKFFHDSNPAALRAIAERLLEADQRDMWQASPAARRALEDAVLEGEGWEEMR